MVHTQFLLPIKVLRYDNEGEYINVELPQFFQEQDTLHESTCPQTPQQNKVAERKKLAYS